MNNNNKCDYICNSECIYNYPEYVNCITYKVIEPLSYIMSTLLMISHGQDVAKNMLSTSIASINSIIDWVKGLQHLQNIRPCYVDKDERRLTPRVDIELPVIIGKSEYKTKNISICGCLVQADDYLSEMLKVRDKVNLKLRLNCNEDSDIILKSEVTRKNNNKEVAFKFLEKDVEFLSFMYNLYQNEFSK